MVKVGACNKAHQTLREELPPMPRSICPGFPAFTNRLGVPVWVDLFETVNAVFYGFSRVFVCPLNRFEERPKEGQRKKAPVQVAQWRFNLKFFLLTSSGVTQGPADGQADRERADNCRYRVLAQDVLGPFPRGARFVFGLFPSLARGLGSSSNRPPRSLFALG